MSLSAVAKQVYYLVERNLLLLVTSASDLPLHKIKFCSLCGEVVYAGCDRQDSLMHGSLGGKRMSTVTAIN